MALLFTCFILILQSGLIISQQHCWDTEGDLKRALADAESGDEVCLGNGEYIDLKIEMSRDGVSLKGQEGGKVILKGGSVVKINAARVQVSNLMFTAPLSSTADRNRPSPIEFGYDATHCTVSDCVIDDHSANTWVKVRGKHNVVKQCSFKNKPAPELTSDGREVSASNIVSVNAVGMENNNIHHSKFLNYDPDARKAKHKHGTAEAIFVKLSRDQGRETKKLNCKVNNNYFYKVDGEEETIGIKSSGNEVFENAIEYCYGGISLRHGRDNIVRDNYIRGRPDNSPNNYGINAHDANHVIKSNWVKDVGKHHGIRVVGGNGPLDCNSCHVRAKNITIKDNTLINSVLYLGRKFSSGTYSEPDDIRIDTITSSLSSDQSSAMIKGQDLSKPGTFNGKPYLFSGINRFYGHKLAYINTLRNLQPLLDAGKIVWDRKFKDLGIDGVEMIRKIKCATGASWDEKDEDC